MEEFNVLELDYLGFSIVILRFGVGVGVFARPHCEEEGSRY